MSAVDIALPQLRTDEGFRARAYRDTRGNLSIGYGFNVDAGISEFAANALLIAQTQERAAALAKFWWAQGLDDVRMAAIIEISFNAGLDGLLHYVKMLAAIGAKNWDVAHAECLDSDAARELPARYNALAEMIRTGEINAKVKTVG